MCLLLEVKFLTRVVLVTLIRSTLSTLANHVMQFTILTSNVINTLEQLQHIFLWGSTPIIVNFIQSNGLLLKLRKLTVALEFNIFL